MYLQLLSLALLFSHVWAFYPYGSDDGDQDRRSLSSNMEARDRVASGGITLGIKRMRVGWTTLVNATRTDAFPDEEGQYLYRGQVQYT